MSDDIRPFRVEVPQAVLDDLRDRLGRTRWPDQIPSSGWDYGTDLGYLRDLCETWRTTYDWRAQEDAVQPVAALPHRHRRRAGPLHPRTFAGTGRVPTRDHPRLARFGVRVPRHHRPALQPAAHGGDPKDAFHVVCPSIPGYGWSGPTTQPGWDVLRVANAWKELMARLGYERYGAQGGDWGAIISATLATIDDTHVAGLHSNMLLAFPAERGRAVADRGRGRRPRGGRRIHAAGERVSGDPGQEPADARLRAHRFTRGARGLDRREVLRMDRPRR